MNGSIFDRLPFPLPRVPKTLLLAGFLVILAATAFIEFHVSGLARRSFVFYDIDSGLVSVENRMLVSGRNQVSGGDSVSGGDRHSREVDVTRYVEEALLGPVFPNSLPLFPSETRLRSLLYRDGTVYADLSAEAALPPVEGGEVFNNLKTLRSGIKRNFSFVGDVRFFIAGKAAYRDELGRDDAPGGWEGWF
jgi:hypothetical protein